jgi:hypothetical protein
VDFDPTVQILSFNGRQQRPEPLEGSKITADPEKVDLAEAGPLLRIVHTVPNTLQDRRERRNANTGTAQHCHLIFEDIFGSAAKRPINVDSWEDSANRRINITVAVILVDSHHGGYVACVTRLEFTAKGLRERLGEISGAPNMYRNVIFLWSTGKGEGMILPKRHLRTAKENVLQKCYRWLSVAGENLLTCPALVFVCSFLI